MNPQSLKIISSMATKKLLGELIQMYQQQHADVSIQLESVGGVDAAKRLQAGEALDGAVLASDAIDKLMTSGHILSASRVDIVRSGVAIAVKEGAPQPDVSNEEAVKQAVLSAQSIGYSTGPSGVQLAALFERWGIGEKVKSKIVVPPPGIPVGSLVASGEVALGFQQLSELMNLPGIHVIGALPPPIEIATIFSCGVATASKQPDAVRNLFAFFASPATSMPKRENGMEPI